MCLGRLVMYLGRLVMYVVIMYVGKELGGY
jgi:hypothetical protein